MKGLTSKYSKIMKEWIIGNWFFRFCRASIRKLTYRKRALEEIYWKMNLEERIKSSASTRHLVLKSGGWAIGPAGLCLIWDAINQTEKPKVLEFGLGESTKLIEKLETKCHTVVEHDRQWADHWTQSFLKEVDDIKAEIRIVPAVMTSKSSRYEISPDDFQMDYNIFIVDGPFGSSKNSRLNILDFIPNWKSDKEFIIVIDDIHRSGELQLFASVKTLLTQKGIGFRSKKFSDRKQVGIICSSTYWSIVSF